MAIYMNSDGFWVNTEKKEEEPESFYASLAKKSTSPGAQLGNNDIAKLLVTQQLQNDQIQTFTDQFTPLRESEAGQQALTGLISDSTAPTEQRAGALQALNPGLKVTVGSSGELSLTAKPGDSLGFNYPGQMRKDGPGKGNAPKTDQELLAPKISDYFTQLQATDDLVEVTTIQQNLNLAAAEFTLAKKRKLEMEVGAPLRIDQLEEQYARDRMLDEEYYRRQFPGQVATDSQETLATRAALSRAKVERDVLVEKKLAEDPELLALRTQMTSAQALLQQKLSTTVEATPGVVDPTLTNNATAALWGPGASKATDKERADVLRELASGNPNAVSVKAAEIGGLPPVEQAIRYMVGGDQTATWAGNALSTRLTDKKILDDLKYNVDNFDAWVAKSQVSLTKEQKEQLAESRTAISPKEKAADSMRVRQVKASIVLSTVRQQLQQAFESDVTRWDAPQDPAIRDEWAAVVGKLQAADQKPHVQTVIKHLDWENPDKVKVAALANYLNSQAARIPNSILFPPPAAYASPEWARTAVESAIATKKAEYWGTGGPASEALRLSDQLRAGAIQPGPIRFTDWRDLYPNKEGTEK